MKTTRLMTLFVIAFVLALGAGLSGGLLLARLPAAASGGDAEPVATNGGSGSLADVLRLSPDQRDRMRAIWEGTRAAAQGYLDDGQRLQRDRDDALVALLTDAQKEQYEKITRDYADRFAAVTRKREVAFREAVDRTRAILNDAQRRQYDQLLHSRVDPASLKAITGPDVPPPPAVIGPVDFAPPRVGPEFR
jgi:hypothetical protein